MGKGVRYSILIALASFVLVLASCAHTTPFKDRMYIQSFGTDGQLVLTVNAQSFDVEEFASENDVTLDSQVQYIADRMTRLSIVLFDRTGEYRDYPANYGALDFDGAIEGNYSKALLNTALKLGGALTEEKGESGLRFFTDEQSGIQAAVPKNGVILFSSSDIEANYEKAFGSAYSDRDADKVISDEKAQMLASSMFGIYVSNPKTMLDIGLDVPQSALENIEYILIMMDTETLSVDFKLKSESLAKSFSVILKASYVGDLRRDGLPIDFEQLKSQFVQELDMVYIRDLGLTDQQRDAVKAVALQLLDVFKEI